MFSLPNMGAVVFGAGGTRSHRSPRRPGPLGRRLVDQRTLREPQRGHLRRSGRRGSGIAAPRVHTSVCMSSSQRMSHSRMRLIVSRGPKEQRRRTRQPSKKASPIVSTAMRTKNEQMARESRLFLAASLALMETRVARPAPMTDADPLEEATNQAISACGGDARAAVKALVIANAFLEAGLETVRSVVSFGYARGRFPRRKVGSDVCCDRCGSPFAKLEPLPHRCG
jgi:hypothetical protein